MVKKYALDCEMVGSGRKSMLARVSIVDEFNHVVLDTYVKPTGPVTDYRYRWSGVTKEALEYGVDIYIVGNEVARIIRDSLLIGHSLHYDLGALLLYHPEDMTWDLATYPLTLNSNGTAQSLKKLAKEYLNREIQVFVHNSVEDARACMDLYKFFVLLEQNIVKMCTRKPKPENNNTCSDILTVCFVAILLFIFLYILYNIWTSPKEGK